MRAQPTTKALIEMLYERLPEIFHRPQHTWQGLTDEEAQWLYDNCRTPGTLIDMVEAKLREKNSSHKEKNT